MKLGPVIPVLRMFDVGKAREFYLGFLGFAVDWEHRFEYGMPLYMQISREGCALHLSEHHGDACPAPPCASRSTTSTPCMPNCRPSTTAMDGQALKPCHGACAN